ncbi:MAG: hypothetical protein AAGA75_07835 [Cyanobacteria bacterium P01_E01_bin.6]
MVEIAQQLSTVDIRPVTTDAEREMFLDVPSRVYQGDENWVPPLRSSIAKEFASTNTFFDYGELQQLIAVRTVNGKDEAVGRVVAALNHRLIEKEGQSVGLIGYFECVHEFEVAAALLDAACDWLRSHGMTLARGPIDLSTHNRCLFLVDGFDSPPMIMMPYNPPYYPEFFERYGWYKGRDAYAYKLDLEIVLPPQYEKGYRIAMKSGVTFRKIRTKGDAFWEDVRAIYQLFTTSFADNYSSSTRTEEEFLEEAMDLKDLVDPDIFWIAEYDNEMVGFLMAMPDYNIVLKRVNGKLNWVGLLKFLWYRRQIDQARIIVICSLPEQRRRMVPFGLTYLAMINGTQKKRPYKCSEMGYIYEDNTASRKITEASGSKIYKTYRIYEKAL